ncbi:MAG: hypothetical protein K6G13_02070 [Agathobacter sp.]|uniref:hypothetical protein n=1 Tax=Agathobacter sp. TaxID=2021311 RepID=UPI00068D15F1|nr:hypothetical protein [Agathobacter sp.]MCR5676798.1 hypothetical protein [Agathobacter sp.]
MGDIDINAVYNAVIKRLHWADAILISAGPGMASAEGYKMMADTDDYKKYFGEFREKYQVTGVYQALFAPMTTDDKARFREQLRKYLVDDYEGSEVYRNLKKLMTFKPYFVVTSNGDRHFQMNGFEEESIYEIEGNFFGLEKESTEWLAQKQRFRDFLQAHEGKNILQLEFGIKASNKTVKAPLMLIVSKNPNMRYVTFNTAKEISIRIDIMDRSLAVPGRIADALKILDVLY